MHVELAEPEMSHAVSVVGFGGTSKGAEGFVRPAEGHQTFADAELKLRLLLSIGNRGIGELCPVDGECLIDLALALERFRACSPGTRTCGEKDGKTE